MSKIRDILGAEDYDILLENSGQIEVAGEKVQDLSREDLLVVLTFTLQDKQEMIEEQLRENKLRADSLQKTDSAISDKSA